MANGGYAKVEGIVWRPVHPDAGRAEKLSTAWAFWGAVAAAALFVVAFLLVGIVGEFTAGLVALTGAVSVGALLVVAGVGMLQLEALRAEAVRAPSADVSARFAASDTPTATLLTADVLKVLRQGLSGLTAARAAIFAGAFLLAVAALGGGISLTGDDDADGSTPTPTPSVVTEAPSDPPSDEPTDSTPTDDEPLPSVP